MHELYQQASTRFRCHVGHDHLCKLLAAALSNFFLFGEHVKAVQRADFASITSDNDCWSWLSHAASLALLQVQRAAKKQRRSNARAGKLEHELNEVKARERSLIALLNQVSLYTVTCEIQSKPSQSGWLSFAVLTLLSDKMLWQLSMC